MNDNPIINKTELKDQITSAIGIHGLWKNRIREAISTGKSDWDPAFVKPCGNCDFGKWLNSFPPSSKDDHYKDVYKLHAAFHEEAARVLDMALKGKKAEAEKASAFGSEYTNLTSKLTKAMMDWKSAS